MFLWSIQSVLFGQFYLHIFVQSGMLLMKFLYTWGFYVECWFLRRTDKLRENKYKFCQEFNIFINSYKKVQGLQFGDDTKMHFSDCKQSMTCSVILWNQIFTYMQNIQSILLLYLTIYKVNQTLVKIVAVRCVSCSPPGPH